MDNVCVSRTTTAATSGGARLNHVVATLVDLETCMVADEINPHHAVGTRAYFHPKMMTNAAQKRAPYADLSVYEVDVWAFAVMVLVIFREQHAWPVPHASNRNYQKFQSYVFDTPSAWAEDLRIVQSAGLNHNVVAENMVYTALRVLRTYHQSPPTALESREGHNTSTESIMEAFTWRP
ncbi:hypothetical protein SARC_17753 [Sphaeroforma arctica JP610]|uniref:Protein kinase domain-containing protein n=1 Tax=Sphaeroforma arctica JP610 TaxID=667725 RepID=A0A0L0EZ08_9EUKA|nr:hypothetical protein SARC_17753 [Sphaeroforma arctica JP610]KNC69730.1 hypothetical protein SARC_17753 [Sphaeroforma arctica JP610]|eukprot:XP_014143632.1 hypothetical protein SARC_17753 [Sphaeroforma arctica JP610]